MKISVLGGGISGLVAAYNLSLNPNAHVILYEASSRFGGWIETSRTGSGGLIELGPHSLRTVGAKGTRLLEFLDEIALTDDVLPVAAGHPAAKVRYLGLNGELLALPHSFRHLLSHSHRGSFVGGVWRDLTTRGRFTTGDESVHSFFERRFGRALADLVSDPMCRGISAADCRTLSVQGMFPALVEAELNGNGSVIKGLINQSLTTSPYVENKFAREAKYLKWKMMNFRHGMEQLPRALYNILSDRKNVDIFPGSPVVDLTVRDPGVSVTVGEGVPRYCDHVVSALPAHVLAKCIKHHEPGLSESLSDIDFVDVALVTLEYDKKLEVKAFGCLLPSYENPQVLGVIFDSVIFPDHNGTSPTRLTVMVGGEWACPDTPHMAERAAVDVVSRYLGITDTPAECTVRMLEKSTMKQAVAQGAIIARQKAISMCRAAMLDRPFYRLDPEFPLHGGDLVARALQVHNVKQVFTLAGGHISPVLTACESLGIRVVDTRHEASAAFAADAAARVAGGVGVCVVTAGPGITNTITAIKNAQMAETPVLLIGGAAPSLLRGRVKESTSTCRSRFIIVVLKALGLRPRALSLLGGGISGLVAAYNLSLNPNAHVILYEASSRFGGWIETSRTGSGGLIELGPHSLRTVGAKGTRLLEFLDEIALTDDVLPVAAGHPAAKVRYLGLNGELLALPYSFRHLLSHSHRGSFVGGVWRDLTTRGRFTTGDESVHSFFERRFGRALADLVSDPMCRGISAADCRTLSVQGMFPALVEAELNGNGSVIKGLINQSLTTSPYVENKFAREAKYLKWKMMNFRHGMEQLPRALYNILSDRKNVDIFPGSPVVDLTVRDPGVSVTVGEGVPRYCDHVVSALPAHVLAKCIKHHEPGLSESLSDIDFVDVALVTLEYDKKLEVKAFGCLLPSYENPQVLGVIFDSVIFPDHNGTSPTRLTVMVGGEWAFPDTPHMAERAAVDVVSRYLGITDSPAECNVRMLEKSTMKQAVAQGAIIARQKAISMCRAAMLDRPFYRLDPEFPLHGGDLVARALQVHNVKQVFTLAGGHISPVLTACESLGIRVVDTRHEASAAFAADAAARVAGGVGVCVVTAGPGITNTITAIKNAQMAETPVLLIGGAAPSLLRGRGAKGTRLLEFLDEIALTDDVLPVAAGHPAAKVRYLGLNGELLALPHSFRHLLSHSHRGSFVGGVWRDLTTRGRFTTGDESVHSFFERRFGRALADLVSDPMCRGISAADCRTLSVQGMFPALVEAELNGNGSVIKGLINQSLTTSPYVENKFAREAKYLKWKMMNFRHGMEQLPRALYNILSDRKNVDIFPGSPVVDLTVRDPGVSVTVGEGVPRYCDHVVSALPAHVLAKCIKHHEPGLSESLSDIDFVDVALVTLEYDKKLEVKAFGCLLPSYENPQVLGVIFDSVIFPDHNGTSPTRLTVMVGGEWAFPDTPHMAERAAVDVVSRYLGITDTPAECTVRMLEKCIPHYTLGHADRVRHMFGLIKEQQLRLSLVFTLAGGHISPVLTACESLGIRVVDTRHEASAAFAADAAARVAGGVGVCVVTAGPGITNTITAIKNAQMAETPVLLIGGAAPSLLRGRGALQDIDQVSVLRSLCKETIAVDRVREVQDAVCRAIQTACTGVPGPVFLELPVDVLYPYYTVKQMSGVKDKSRGIVQKVISARVNALFAGVKDEHTQPRPVTRIPVNAGAGQIQAIFAQAKRPVVVVGTQALIPHGPKTAEKLAYQLNQLGAPVYLGMCHHGNPVRGMCHHGNPVRGMHVTMATLYVVCVTMATLYVVCVTMATLL
eukprot:sb/3460661/